LKTEAAIDIVVIFVVALTDLGTFCHCWLVHCHNGTIHMVGFDRAPMKPKGKGDARKPNTMVCWQMH